MLDYQHLELPSEKLLSGLFFSKMCLGKVFSRFSRSFSLGASDKAQLSTAVSTCLTWNFFVLRLELILCNSFFWENWLCTHTNSPNLSLVWINAHDLWSWTAHARRRRGGIPFAGPIDASDVSKFTRIIGLEPLLRDAIWRPPPIILKKNQMRKSIFSADSNVFPNMNLRL